MIIDGTLIAREIKNKLKALAENLPESERPTLFIVSISSDAVTKSFISVKKKFANDIGIVTEEVLLEEVVDTISIIEVIKKTIAKGRKGGIVVQLPLPQNIDIQSVLNAVPLSCDIDVLSEESFNFFKDGKLLIYPPVVGAIREILERNSVFLRGKKIAIVGQGRLVGKPATVWFRRIEADVRVFDIDNPPNAEDLRGVDIILSGVGKPGFITEDMVTRDTILLDAGTSEEGGRVVGDATLEATLKCALATPVPGGIGPVAVAVLFQNLFTLRG